MRYLAISIYFITWKKVFHSLEILLRSLAIILRYFEILLRSLAIILRSFELLFHFLEILLRENAIVFRGNAYFFEGTKYLFRGNEIKAYCEGTQYYFKGTKYNDYFICNWIRNSISRERNNIIYICISHEPSGAPYVQVVHVYNTHIPITC